MGSTNFLLKPVFKLWDRTFHDGNVQWYATDKTHIKKLFLELETLAGELVVAENEYEKTTICNAIVHASNLLVIECEKLVAFMNYKHDLYKKEYPFASNGMKMMTNNIIEETKNKKLMEQAMQNLIENWENSEKEPDPNTLTDDQKKDSFYLVRIRTTTVAPVAGVKPVAIIPGMTATVHIQTGAKTFLHYLLKPVIKTKDLAFRER